MVRLLASGNTPGLRPFDRVDHADTRIQRIEHKQRRWLGQSRYRQNGKTGTQEGTQKTEGEIHEQLSSEQASSVAGRLVSMDNARGLQAAYIL